MKVSIIHLDLGIGGAERLIVNTSIVLKELGYNVTIITSHHDKKHCFEETNTNGILSNHIIVYGDWIPRNILGKGTAFFAIVRMIYMTIILIINSIIHKIYYNDNYIDYVFIDGVSASIPLLTLVGIPVLFYCHFPDKLLCVERKSLSKKLYRLVIDALEEITTGCSTMIIVNSLYTAKMFNEAFPYLGKACTPSVLYPTIEQSNTNSNSNITLNYVKNYDHIFVSLNRYERKKEIGLALHSLAQLKQSIGTTNSNNNNNKILLVIAGGYDHRVNENVEYLIELQQLASNLNLVWSCNDDNNDKSDVVFRISISNEERQELLRIATALLYTPANEHFGIVPLEAMYMQTPVIAVNSGGPLETIIEGVTGYLCEQQPQDFSNAMLKFINDKSNSSLMGKHGKEHVIKNFTSLSMKKNLEIYSKITKNEGTDEDKRRVNKFQFMILLISISIIIIIMIIIKEACKLL